jgi:hypothetical protein
MSRRRADHSLRRPDIEAAVVANYLSEHINRNRWNRYCAALLCALILCACSNRQVYTAIQQNQQLECQKLPGTQYEECMKQVSEPYDVYKRDRDELVEDN